MPTFWLPTIDLLVRALIGHSWMIDQDTSDMFLNYQLHQSVIPFTGVNLSLLYKSDNNVGPCWAM